MQPLPIKPAMAFWGKHGGKVMKDGSLGIQQQQWGVGITNSGNRSKATQRRERKYANRKLQRKGRNG